MITDLGLILSLQKSDKNAYESESMDEVPNPWINCDTITIGIELSHPPKIVTKLYKKIRILEIPTVTIKRQRTTANFLLFVSDTKFIANRPIMHPIANIDWMRSLAH